MYCSTVESESFLEKAFFLCVCSKMFTNHYVKCIQIQPVAEYTAMYKKTLTVTKKKKKKELYISVFDNYKLSYFLFICVFL